MNKLKPAPFKFKPFSDKHKKILTWWMDESPVHDYDGIIADGAIRSGKTISMSLSYIIWAMERFNNQNFGMAGKTIGSFRRNVLATLKLMLKSRGYRFEDRRTDNLFVVKRGDVINYFYIFGGKDERSQDLIQGITLAGMFFDEVALMPESFVNQATARCSVDGSKYWFNCNPANPFHWFKKDWIDKKDEKKLCHIHFLMEDNLSLSKETIEKYKRNFKGLFYKRFILGLWVAAEGVIYSMFDEKRHTMPRSEMPKEFDRKFICCDFGVNNPTVFLKYGVLNGFYYELDEYYWDSKIKGDKTVGGYANDMQKFTDGDEEAIYIDPSAKALIIELRTKGFTNIKPAINNVLDGISTVCTVLDNDKLLVNPENKNSIKEGYSYVWDSKAALHGIDAPVKQDDHAMDARRYGIHTDYMIQLAKQNNSQRGSGGNRNSR